MRRAVGQASPEVIWDALLLTLHCLSFRYQVFQCVCQCLVVLQSVVVLCRDACPQPALPACNGYLRKYTITKSEAALPPIMLAIFFMSFSTNWYKHQDEMRSGSVQHKGHVQRSI